MEEDGTYNTSWVCPFCEYNWQYKPKILEKCPRCKSVTGQDGWSHKTGYYGDTPAVGVPASILNKSKRNAEE